MVRAKSQLTYRDLKKVIKTLHSINKQPKPGSSNFIFLCNGLKLPLNGIYGKILGFPDLMSYYGGTHKCHCIKFSVISLKEMDFSAGCKGPEVCHNFWTGNQVYA